MLRGLKYSRFWIAVVLALVSAAWTVPASAQASLDAPENEVAQPLPGEDGGSAAPTQSLGRNQIMFIVRNEHPRVVDIAFYSNSRRHIWPGANRVYTMRDSKTHHYVLNCVRGEKICYGAGVRNRYRTYWGSGIGGKHRCASCCYTCDGRPTKTIVLNP